MYQIEIIVYKIFPNYASKMLKIITTQISRRQSKTIRASIDINWHVSNKGVQEQNLHMSEKTANEPCYRYFQEI